MRTNTNKELNMNRNQSVAAYALNAVEMVSNHFAQIAIARSAAVKVICEHTPAATFMMCEYCDGSALLCTANDAGYRWIAA